MASCDGCGRGDVATGDVDYLRLCEACDLRRIGDPTVIVGGRTLLLSEAVRQADELDDPAMHAALETFEASNPGVVAEAYEGLGLKTPKHLARGKAKE